MLRTLGGTRTRPQWVALLNQLLSLLSPEDQYVCAAGIPGPMMELRSGALPVALAKGTGITDYAPIIAELTGLNVVELRRQGRKIANHYRMLDVFRRICRMAADT